MIRRQRQMCIRDRYVCIDGAPEHDEGGAANTNGHVIYHVVAQCGTLPCPPYVQGKVVTCVVCSK